MRHPLPLAALLLAAAGAAHTAAAADLTVEIEIPTLNVAEYHRPYVALWIERPDQSVAANLAVWYDLKKPNKEGTKWLQDLRQWWRRSGREQEMPMDAVTSATRAVGKHKLTFADGAKPLGRLPAGDYRLAVEAAREVGGREVVYLPFQWPPQKPQQLKAQGKTELGGVVVDLKP